MSLVSVWMVQPAAFGDAGGGWAWFSQHEEGGLEPNAGSVPDEAERRGGASSSEPTQSVLESGPVL